MAIRTTPNWRKRWFSVSNAPGSNIALAIMAGMLLLLALLAGSAKSQTTSATSGINICTHHHSTEASAQDCYEHGGRWEPINISGFKLLEAGEDTVMFLGTIKMRYWNDSNDTHYWSFKPFDGLLVRNAEGDTVRVYGCGNSLFGQTPRKEIRKVEPAPAVTRTYLESPQPVQVNLHFDGEVDVNIRVLCDTLGRAQHKKTKLWYWKLRCNGEISYELIPGQEISAKNGGKGWVPWVIGGTATAFAFGITYAILNNDSGNGNGDPNPKPPTFP